MSCGNYARDECIIKVYREIYITLRARDFVRSLISDYYDILLWHLLKSILRLLKNILRNMA